MELPVAQRKKKNKPRIVLAPPPPRRLRIFLWRIRDVFKRGWQFRFVKLVSAAGLVFTIIATLSEFTNLLPNIAITDSFSDESNHPYSARYNIVNQGIVPLSDVEFGCFIDSASFGPYSTFSNFVTKQDRRIEWFGRGDIFTTKCMTGINVSSLTPTTGKLFFIVWYKWLSIPRQKTWGLEYVEAGKKWAFRPGKEIDISQKSVLLIKHNDL